MRRLAVLLALLLPVVADAQPIRESLRTRAEPRRPVAGWPLHRQMRTESKEYLAFKAPLHTDRIGPGIWSIKGMPEPDDFTWWCDDDLGAGGQSSTTFTMYSTVTKSDSPFTNGQGTRLQQCYFNGSNTYYAADETSSGTINSADATRCVLFKADDTAAGKCPLAKREDGGAGEGWSITMHGGGSSFYFFTENHDNSTGIGTFNDWDTMTGGYVLLCGTLDYDGNASAWADANVDASTQPSPGGTIASNTALRIGTRGDAGAVFLGYIVGAWGWASDQSANIGKLLAAVHTMAASKGPDVAHDRNSVAWAEDSDGQYQAFADDMAAQTEDGASIHGAVTTISTDSNDVSAWTSSGGDGCAVSTDTTSGPFASYNGGAEADTLTDDQAGASECRYVSPAVADTTAGTKTFSVFLATTDLAAARLLVKEDAATLQTCPVSGLTATFGRHECTGTASGTQADISGWLCPGANDAATGSVIASGGQLEKSSFAGRPCIAGGAAATCAADSVSVATTGWPTSHGRIELTYTPEVADGFGTNRFLLETQDAATDYGYYLRINATTGVLRIGMESVAGAGTTSGSSGLTWTEGTTYTIEIRWWANGVVKAWRTPAGGSRTLVIDDTGADVSDAIDTTAYVGSHNGGNGTHAMGRIENLEVSK